MEKSINVTRSSMPEFEEYIEEIHPIWESRWLTNSGEKYHELRRQLEERTGSRHIIMYCNGHLALEAAFAQLEPGSEVITTPFTYVSTTLAIIRAGLVPVFCDIEPVFYTMDPDKIEQLITEKTSAIVPVHVYGNICDYQKIESIAAKHGLKVIYDAAHAFNEWVDERNVGQLGDISMFSFHATKVFHTIEGGCLCTDDDDIAEKVTVWKKFGVRSGDNMEMEGCNAKMTEFSAAMGICNLRHIEEQIELRHRAYIHYRERLCGRDGLILCPVQENVTSNYAYFPVQFDEQLFGKSREDVVAALSEHNIGARKYFYPLTCDTDLCISKYGKQEVPIANRVSSQVLCLPLYAGLIDDDIDRVCDIILYE